MIATTIIRSKTPFKMPGDFVAMAGLAEGMNKLKPEYCKITN